MPEFEDDSEGFHASRRVPGRFYVSRRFPPDETDDQSVMRFAYEVRDVEADEILFESSEGWEITLRSTPTRQQLKAIFFEQSRGVYQLAFQRFGRNGNPIDGKKTLLLEREEVHRLRSFLEKIDAAELHGADAVRFSESAITQLLRGVGIPTDVLRERSGDIAEFLRQDVTAPEVVALARRRAKLAEFRDMLQQDLSEPEWQSWFEAEPWVLGFGVAPQFLHVIGADVEQVVAGFDMVSGGTRTDAVLRTAGQSSSLVFVEIKRPGAELLKPTQYRSVAWVPEKDVVGGVAQLHSATDAARRTLDERYHLQDGAGHETGETAELCRPRSVLVVGQLASLFNAEGRPHRLKFRSFESYRRSIHDPEIITFDEVLARASAAVSLSE